MNVDWVIVSAAVLMFILIIWVFGSNRKKKK